MRQEEAFDAWLAGESWAVGVRYCKAVAWLLPLGALALDLPLYLSGHASHLPSLLAWQAAVEAASIAVVLTDRFWPAIRGREAPLYLFCGVFMALVTWVGVAALWLGGNGMVLYAAGSTFIAAVICTPRPVRRPLYVASLAALAVPVWLHTASPQAVLASLVNPFCVVMLCMGVDRFTYSRNLALYRAMQQARAERERADKVLYNVLPASIADELKRDGRVSAVKFENLGVLFADIAGFTGYSRALPPDALVMMLNQIFTAFDAVVERHGLEKIKTIGDAYMVVSYQRVDALCGFALDVQGAMAAYNRVNGTTLSMRIGIHAGPAVAGVIGVTRFLYDVWGDTVNVASRLEASGSAGAIHVSEAVARQAAGGFAFEQREAVEIKGRGPMATYWLLGATA